MSFFSKPEYQEILLPFVYDNNPEDWDVGMVSIEAYGNVFGEMKYCYATYSVDLSFLDEIADLLRNSAGKTVRVTLKIKNGNVKDFKLSLESLAEAYQDDRLVTLELVAWGLNDQSYRELMIRNGFEQCLTKRG